MKLYIINPMYMSLILLIVFVALSSSISIFPLHGKTYLDSDYELVFGGQKVLKINQNTITGLESYRKLTGDEKIRVQKQMELLDIQREKDRKQWTEEREREQKLHDEGRDRRLKQREIELQKRCNNRDMYLKQQDEERRQRNEERLQRGLLRYATPYYDDNSYMGRRRYAEECPMRKAQGEKKLQQQKRKAEKKNIRLSLPNPSEQGHSQENRAEKCPIFKVQREKNKSNSDAEEEPETKTAKREMDRSQRRRNLERREGIQIQHKIKIVKPYPVRKLRGTNVKKPQYKQCFEVSSNNEKADKPKKPIKR